jgi:hypothetical protein
MKQVDLILIDPNQTTHAAMAAGVTNTFWTVSDLVQMIEA